jgi:hypothetical protein
MGSRFLNGFQFGYGVFLLDRFFGEPMKLKFITPLLLCLLALLGCQASPTTQPITPLTDEQQQHDDLLKTLQLAELGYSIADSLGVISPSDEEIATAADASANAALAADQTAINAGDTNGIDIALKSFEAALAQLDPILNAGKAKALALKSRKP